MRKSEMPVAGLIFAGLILIFFLPRLVTPPGLFFGALQEQYYLLGQYAYEHQILRALAAGFFPLWNPDNGLGHPLLGNMLSAALFPLKWLIYLIPTAAMRELYLLLRIFLAAFFTYLFARGRLSRPAAAFAAVAFAFTGYFQFFINENYLNAETLIPVLLILGERLAGRGRLCDLAWLALAGFAVFTNGHPEAALYVLLFAALYYFAVPGFNRAVARRMFLMMGALWLGLLLASPMLVPFVEYWFRGYHFHLPGTGFYHYDLREAAALVSPWFFPPPPAGAASYHPMRWSWDLAAHGVPGYRETIVPWLIPAVGGLTLVMALSGFIPGGRLFPDRGRISADRRALFFAAFALFFLGVMFGLPGFRWLGLIPPFNLSGNFKHPLPAVAFSLAYLAGKGLDRLLLLVPPGKPRAGAAAAVLLLGLLELQTVGWWLKPFDPGYLARLRRSAAVRRLQSEPGRFRVYVADRLLPPNLNLYFRFADVRVMDGVNDRRLVEAINALNGHDRIQAGNYWYQAVGYLQPRPEALGSPVLDSWSLKYVLAVRPGPTAAVLPAEFELVSAEPFAGGELLLWRRPGSFPPAWFAEAADGDPAAPVEVAAYSAERIILQTEPMRAGWVTLADLYYPGWEASVHGRPVRIERVRGLLRGVRVPAGKSEIVFCYRPRSFRVGLWAALTSAAAGVLFGLFQQWQKLSLRFGRV